MPDKQPDPETTNSAVITGGEQRTPSHRRRTILIVLAIVVLAAVAGYTAYRFYDNYRDQQAAETELKQKAEALGDSYDYTGFTPEQVAIKLQAVGLDWEAARHGNLTDLSFEQAYAVARALRTDSNYERSLEAYKVAAAELSKEADYTFYRGYSEVALFADKIDLWKQVMQEQKQAILADDSLDKDTKQIVTAEIDEAIRLKELGW
ncbi:MAG TPA: hypothetical protein VFG56_02830 [Candidatus Saccharimonadales bacterium]|nr:hypothetical protein [Candidatus Saccharimonadales bacterium]